SLVKRDAQANNQFNAHAARRNYLSESNCATCCSTYSRAGRKSLGSRACPAIRTSKCRCEPVDWPVDPTRAINCPFSTTSPNLTTIDDAWAYRVLMPLP